MPLVARLGLSKYIRPHRDVIDPLPPYGAEYRAIARSLLTASVVKVFVTLTMVWNYPESFLHLLNFFLLTSHATALQAAADCTVVESAAVVAVGYAALLAARAALLLAGVATSFSFL